MNNNKTFKWITGAMTSAVIAAGISACTDDHFDINSDVLGKGTIWENIKSNPNLSDYADILESVYFSHTEQKTTPETYADIFNGEQTFTVWAPINGSFDYSYYKNLLATGNRDSIYKVEKELIRNNMTRFSHVLNGKDSLKLDLFNAKTAWLNYDKKSVKGSNITTANIGSTNGVLHIVDAPIAYQYNLYEFMASRHDLDSLNTFIKGFQTVEFNEASSTQGPTINGSITYVDSITYIDNSYTRGFMNAYIQREDSNYVMIMPTNNAWEKQLAKTTSYFNYKNEYKQDIHALTEQGADTLIQGATTNFSQVELDSIVNLYSKNAMVQNLAYNANWQFKQIPITSIADINAADSRNDSLYTTAGTKIKKMGSKNITNDMETVEVDNFADIFGNANPVETSNGYAYIVDELKYPLEVFAPELNYVAADGIYESCDNNCIPNYYNKTYNVSIRDLDEDGNVIAQRDSVYKYSYFSLSPKNSTSNPGAFFKIKDVHSSNKDVLSCKYDIFVVIGYNTEYNLPNKFRAYISYDTEAKRIENEALKNPNEDALDAKDASIYNTNYFVNKPLYVDENLISHYTDTICIAKDFEFPICYRGLTNAYPVIQIKSNFTSGEKNLYSREIWVERIILKAKEQ